MTKTVDTLILGAGLSGLSTAYHLQQLGKKDFLILEKAPVVGGLCASTTQNGFTFDYGGHLLHLHTPEGQQLVEHLLKNNLQTLSRRAFIDTYGVRVPFPFQAHLYALPEKIRRACALGLQNAPRILHPKTFQTWCLTHFGNGIYTHFLKPYNTKLWQLPLEQLTCTWCRTFVPNPTPAQIAQSLTQPPTQDYGYNASFYYPKKGGIGALAEALAKPLQARILQNAPVSKIDLTRKTALVNGQKIHFRKLVNTLALPAFIQLLDRQKVLQKAASCLSAADITVYHLAVNRQVNPFSWIYFPDEQTPFYRVGLQSGFSPAASPENTSLLYIELPGLKEPTPALEKQIWNALVQKGIIEETDKPIFNAWQPIANAYVHYTFAREKAVKKIQDRLRAKGVFCVGRYGRWEYSFMESALLQGKETAHILAGSKQ